MKKETFSQRRIDRQLVSVVMLGLLLTPVTLQSASTVLAEDKAVQSLSNVDSELKSAIEKAKSLGIKVNSEGKKEFQSTAELNAFKQEQLNKVQNAIEKAEASVSASKKAKEDYDNAKKKYDQEQSDYQKAKELYTKSKESYDKQVRDYNAAKSEYEKALSQYNTRSSENKKLTEEYNKKKAEYDVVKKKYDEEMKVYNEQKSRYDKELEVYNQKIKDAERLKTQEGYLSEAKAQSLIFNNEPGATISKISGQAAYLKKSKFYSDKIHPDAQLNLSTYEESDYLKDSDDKSGNQVIKLAYNQPVRVEYTSLNNSSYNGIKISKVVYTYTLIQSEKWQVLAEIYNDPTKTIRFGSSFDTDRIEIKLDTEFYDENGKKIQFSEENPALVSFSSLNSYGRDYREYVKDLKGLRFIKINGSSVDYNGTRMQAQESNENARVDRSSKYYDWDRAESPVAYYGAGAAMITNSDISFVFGAYRDRRQWFAFNGAVKAKDVVIKPVEPKKPSKPDLTEPVPPKSTNNTKPTPPTPPTTTEPKEPARPVTPEPKTPAVPEEQPPLNLTDAVVVNTTHVEVGTDKELAPKEEGTKPKKSIDGYNFVETKTKDGNTIHYYTKKVYTRHYDIETKKELAPQEDGTQPKKTFDGYEFVETKTKDGDTEHFYRPIKKVYTRHYDIETKKELSPQEDGTQPKRTFDGYEFVETKTKDGDTEHFYRPIPKPEPKKPDPIPATLVITKHIDITTGKELTKQEEGTKPKRSFDGYEFVETKTEDGNTIHFYKPVDKVPIKPKEDKKVHTRHYDVTTGKELAPQEDGTQPKRDFEGYEFVETKDKDGDTEHFYKPVKKVVTKHIDKKTGKELVPQEDGTQPKKDIPGYRFVETKDEDGNTIHYYEQVITKHLEVETNKELAPQEDGTQPKKEIEGYEFVETKDENGDTIHYYKPVTKVYTKHIDKDTGKELAPQEDGKQPKREFEGYEFVETKDDNGNTIHYYQKLKTPTQIKGKTPTKYAETNESSGTLATIVGLSLASVLAFIAKRRKSN